MSDPFQNTQQTEIINKHLLPYPSSTLDPNITLIDRAREIEAAGEIVKGQLHGKLDLIQKQIQALQKQALELLAQSRENLELHQVKCNFEKKIGQPIFLYKKDSGDMYFSLLSKEDWKDNPPHEFINTYILQPDRSFKKIN